MRQLRLLVDEVRRGVAAYGIAPGGPSRTASDGDSVGVSNVSYTLRSNLSQFSAFLTNMYLKMRGLPTSPKLAAFRPLSFYLLGSTQNIVCTCSLLSLLVNG